MRSAQLGRGQRSQVLLTIFSGSFLLLKKAMRSRRVSVMGSPREMLLLREGDGEKERAMLSTMYD